MLLDLDPLSFDWRWSTRSKVSESGKDIYSFKLFFLF
jgi:hypothetical protein